MLCLAWVMMGASMGHGKGPAAPPSNSARRHARIIQPHGFGIPAGPAGVESFPAAGVMMRPLRPTSSLRGEATVNATLTLIDLAGSIALLLWGVHMVQSGIQRAFGPNLRRIRASPWCC
jgi:hypothetical protein